MLETSLILKVYIHIHKCNKAVIQVAGAAAAAAAAEVGPIAKRAAAVVGPTAVRAAAEVDPRAVRAAAEVDPRAVRAAAERDNQMLLLNKREVRERYQRSLNRDSDTSSSSSSSSDERIPVSTSDRSNPSLSLSHVLGKDVDPIKSVMELAKMIANDFPNNHTLTRFVMMVRILRTLRKSQILEIAELLHPKSDECSSDHQDILECDTW
ncbi:hypothetical protein L9F63_022640 [Diploptera punctata]|uniref:Vitellogenin domain-containing protein n=1 Tax=Diploptera punctata TaxID=6984 RepID=A0AAD7ZLL7_DIPPU|nr:hypothetical protein L9F63_022640 [Diploptera punctata]